MRSVLILGLKIIIILIVILGIYIIFSQAQISYITDHMYFYVYAGEELAQHYWFKDIARTYVNTIGAFHIKEKSRFVIKKLYASLVKKRFAGHGYIDLSQVIKLLQDSTEIPLSSFVPFNVYFQPKSQYLFFTLRLSDSALPRLLDSDRARYSNISDKRFILALKTDKPLEEFEKQIKAHLALYMPTEKSVVLPDGSTFIEQIASIYVFNFEDMVINGDRVRYWEDNDKRIVLWRDKNYIFISNSLLANQNFISRCFRDFEDKEFRQAVYVQIDAYGIEDIILGEKEKILQGCLNPAPKQQGL